MKPSKTDYSTSLFNPDSLAGHLELAQHYQKQSSLSKACYHYQQILEIRPHAPGIHYELARVFHQWGEWDLAVNHYQTTLQQQPDHARAQLGLGGVSQQMGRPALAIACYRTLIEQHPQLLKAHIQLGRLLSQQGSYDEAIEVYQQALHHFPNHPQLYNYLGQVFKQQGHLGSAFIQYSKALALDNSSSKTHENLGRLWFEYEDYKAAKSYFQTASKLASSSASALSNYATAALWQGDLESFQEAIQQSLKLHPDYIELYCKQYFEESGSDLLAQSQFACAQLIQTLLQDQKTELEIAHWLFQVHLKTAEICYEAREFYKAERFYGRALLIRPQEKELYGRLADCLKAQKRIAAAKIFRQWGQQLKPGPTSLKSGSQPSDPQLAPKLGQKLGQKLSPKLTVLPTQVWAERYAQQKTLKDSPYQAIATPCFKINLSDSHPSDSAPSNTVDPQTFFAQQVEDVETCGGVTCQTCMGELIQSFRPQARAVNVFECNLKQAPCFEPSTQFVAQIPQGRAWIAPRRSDWVICDEIAVMTPDHVLLEDISRCYPWQLPPCPKRNRDRHQGLEHSIFKRSHLPPVHKLKGTVALLSTLSGHVYYHWMIDLLPRLGLLQQQGIEFDQIDTFVVNGLSHRFQRETLKQLGVPLERVIESDRYPHIQADHLIVPSFPGHLDWVPPTTIEFLRSHFLAQPQQNSLGESPDDFYPKRIYLSRRRARYRHVLNEAEIEETLTDLGFVTVFLEDLSLFQQAQLFSRAEVIISPHGSGLTNLVFCQPQTQVIEFFAPRYIRTDYWMVSQSLGLKHSYILGRPVPSLALQELMYQSPLTEDIYIELSALRSALRIAKIS